MTPREKKAKQYIDAVQWLKKHGFVITGLLEIHAERRAYMNNGAADAIRLLCSEWSHSNETGYEL